MQKKYFQTDESKKKGKKSANANVVNFENSSKWTIFILTLLMLMPSKEAYSQTTFTLGEGTVNQTTAGVTPFSTDYLSSRTQYLYYGQQLLSQGAVNGPIISMSFNISELALPVERYPENVIIKMKLTPDVVLGKTLVEGLPEYYSAATEVITATGWHTFVLDTPFEWDGFSNILIEVCRSNTTIATTFGVLSELNGQGDYRTVGLFSGETSPAGCNLTGVSSITEADRRYLPNVQFTMSDPCEGTPAAGITVVSPGPYCNGEPFQLTISGGDVASGLTYRWESSPNQNGPWNVIPEATASIYETSQATATYYRRKTTCTLTNITTNSLGVLVDGEGCYCTAEVVTANSVGITNVTFNTINNTSPSNISYSNFTNIQTEVNRNEAYILSARVTTLGGVNYTKAWIDWNKNGEYDANEGYDLGTATGNDVNTSMPQTITIPATAALGATNMRIRSSQSPDNTYPAACGPIAKGEGEDYTINILTSLGVNQINQLLNDVLVYKNQTGIVVEMQNETIAGIKIYDLSGRLLLNKKQINQKSTTIDTIKSNSQVLIFQITTQNGAILYKKQIL